MAGYIETEIFYLTKRIAQLEKDVAFLKSAPIITDTTKEVAELKKIAVELVKEIKTSINYGNN